MRKKSCLISEAKSGRPTSFYFIISCTGVRCVDHDVVTRVVEKQQKTKTFYRNQLYNIITCVHRMSQDIFLYAVISSLAIRG